MLGNLETGEFFSARSGVWMARGEGGCGGEIVTQVAKSSSGDVPSASKPVERRLTEWRWIKCVKYELGWVKLNVDGGS